MNIVGNPVTALSYAEIECESVCSLFTKVYSLDGKLVVNKNLGETQIGLNHIGFGELFTPLPSGTYMLVFHAMDKIFVAKVIK